MSTYDSRPDTWQHIHTVQALMGEVITDLAGRAHDHDQSKLAAPEVEVFDRVTPKLHGLTYGSDEYKSSLAEMGEGLAHHYAVNSHHPEHYANGVNGMDLFDLIEMAADWKAASERGEETAINLSHSLKRFEISEQLADVLRNTFARLGWAVK